MSDRSCPSESYAPHWIDLRRRTRTVWLVLFAWGPLTVLFWVGLQWLGASEPALWLATLPTTLAVAITRVHQVRWPCPRCGRPFYRASWLYWPFADKCLHCGLPEHALNDG